MSILHFLTYFSLLVFIALCIARAVRIATAPVHLRWELYPVPHEKGKAEYGGSYFEESEWWTKKREKDHLGELKVMLPEILLLKGVWEHNRNLWWGSFPLHFGLYLLIGTIVIFAVNAILIATGMSFAELSWLSTTGTAIFWTGCGIGLLGSFILLIKRIFDPALSNFSTPSHYFNIFILGSIYLTGIIWAAADPLFSMNIVSFYKGIITFSALGEIPTIAYLHIGISVFFIFYLPMTHMTHFFTKYFTYHNVRWEDEPNMPDSKFRKKLEQQLNYPVSWSAPHIGADGRKTWLVIATTNPWENKDEEEK
ncbi:MAG: respiratory nitrate reductase subunit gamma [Bacteroidota bacterium]